MNTLRNLHETRIRISVVFLIFLLLIGGVFVWVRYYTSKGAPLEITGPDGSKSALEYGATPALSNPDYYAKVEKELIGQKTSFIDVNLSTMRLSVYQNGIVVKNVTILAKGKKGSWWETPAGLYKVESEIKKHESSFSPVYTDWNLNFQGNFFIHGWPYWVSNGEDVASTYSGGCIRLATADAKEVYDLASVGMPVLVYEEAVSSPYAYTANIPSITSPSYLAADLETNYVFLKNDSDTPFTELSTEKLLTALVATEYMDIERSVSMNGRSYMVYDLLFPLLMKGDEPSAHALRAELGLSYAASLMNQKASAIGMSATTIYRDADGNLTSSSTAEDMFHLSQYLYNYRKFILDLSHGVVTDTAYGRSAFGNIVTTSPLTAIPGYIGGAYEKTPAGKTASSTASALAVFNVDFDGSKRPISIVVLNSVNILGDVQGVLGYLRSAYK